MNHLPRSIRRARASENGSPPPMARQIGTFYAHLARHAQTHIIPACPVPGNRRCDRHRRGPPGPPLQRYRHQRNTGRRRRRPHHHPAEPHRRPDLGRERGQRGRFGRAHRAADAGPGPVRHDQRPRARGRRTLARHLFARQGCGGDDGSTFHCAVGDCGPYVDHCSLGQQPTGLAEFNFDPADSLAPWYDVSYVDAVAAPVTITPNDVTPPRAVSARSPAVPRICCPPARPTI